MNNGTQVAVGTYVPTPQVVQTILQEFKALLEDVAAKIVQSSGTNLRHGQDPSSRRPKSFPNVKIHFSVPQIVL